MFASEPSALHSRDHEQSSLVNRAIALVGRTGGASECLHDPMIS